MIARWSFAVLDRIRSVPRSTWSSFASGGVIGWVLVATLTDAPLTRPVAVGFMLCVVIAVCLCIAIGVVLVRSDEHAERLEHLEIRSERLPDVSLTRLAAMYGGGELSAEEFDAEIDRRVPPLPEDETPEAERGDWYAKLRAGAAAVNARMQPTFLEPEPVAEPAPVVRPSPVPRDPAPATVPLERAWEESAAELTEQQQWEAEQEAKWAAAMARIEEMAKGVGS